MQFYGNKKTAPTPALPLYRSLENYEVRLEDIEIFAIHRLEVLQAIDYGLARQMGPKEMESLVDNRWKLHMRHADAHEAEKKDVISHYMLRYAFCGTKDLRNWFLSMETTLFWYRFVHQIPAVQYSTVKNFNHPYEVARGEELKRMKSEMDQVAMFCRRKRNIFISNATYFKVPFEEVQELLAAHTVYIHEGYAYVSLGQVIYSLAPVFHSQLSKELMITNRNWIDKIEAREEHRMAPIIKKLSTNDLGLNYYQPKKSGEMSITDINKVASSSFPLCMRHMFDKHQRLASQGKMQLGLFLKGAGMPLKDVFALLPLEAEFSQKDSPYTCQQIISSRVTKSTTTSDVRRDHHGCPYQHLSMETLSVVLGTIGVGGHKEEVLAKARNHQCQVACTLAFEAVHGSSCPVRINHPNQYFSDSQEILQQKVVNAKESKR